jgi:hypothetical protein
MAWLVWRAKELPTPSTPFMLSLTIFPAVDPSLCADSPDAINRCLKGLQNKVKSPPLERAFLVFAILQYYDILNTFLRSCLKNHPTLTPHYPTRLSFTSIRMNRAFGEILRCSGFFARIPSILAPHRVIKLFLAAIIKGLSPFLKTCDIRSKQSMYSSISVCFSGRIAFF